MTDCNKSINIVPNNNQIELQNVNNTITVINHNCCTSVDVLQPVTSVVEILTGPMGKFPTEGPYGFTGSFSISGSLTTTGSIYGDIISSPYFTGSFFGNGVGLFSGSFSGSVSSNLQEITDNGSTTTNAITSSGLLTNNVNVNGNITVTGSLLVSGSNTFKNVGPAQFTGSTDITGSLSINGVDYEFTSASFDQRLLNNSSSIAYLSGSYLNSSASFNQRLLNTSSSIGLLSGSFLNTSSSLSIRVTDLENFSSSLDNTFATDAELNAATASLSSSIALLSSSYEQFSTSYNTGSFNGSFTGSFYGTASWAQNAQTASYILNAVSSSFSSTASYLNTLNQDLTFNGNLVLNGTASITYLNVAYESASIIYSSGSNQLGDATNDIQTLIGTTIITGSLQVTGSTNIPSITGSLLGTASYAINAATSSNILGGKATHIPFFITDTTLATSSIYQSGSTSIIINQDNNTTANPEALYVWQPDPTSINVISGKGNLNNYLQLNIQNTNQGINASSDIVATANNGNENIHYIDMGINSENFTGFLGGPNDAYLYSTGHNLWIGNYSDGYKVYFFNSSSEQPIITLNAVDAEITGSLFGTASWAQNAITSSYAISSSYALNADLLDGKDSSIFATTGSNIFIGNQIVTGSLFTTGSNTLIGNTTLTGSLNITGSTTQAGNNTLTGNTTLSGSIIISGSQGSLVPTIQIFGDIDQTGYTKYLPISTNIDTSTSASYIYVSGSTNDLYFSQNGNGYANTTRLRWLEGNIYTGILTGGVISGSVGGTTFNVSSGSGIIVTLNATTASRDPFPTIKYVTWPQFTNITPTYLNTYDTTWLLINSDGNLIQQSVAPTNGEYDTTIQIGSVVHPNLSTISLFKTFTITSYGITQQTYEFIRSFGGLKISGHQISPSGSSLSLNRSSGVAYALGRNYINDANKPSLVTDSEYNAPNVFKYYKSGSAFVTTTGTNVLDPTNYNTPSTPTGLSSVPGGQYTIQRIFYFPNQINTIGVYYGRETYNSISTALSNLPYEDFEENNNTLTQAIFLGYVVVRSGTSNLSNTSDARIILAGTFRNTTGGGGGAAVATSLNDLSDVAIAGVSTGDILVYTGAEWQNTKNIPSITGSLLGTASFAINSTSASYALTASYVQNAISSSYALTASYVANASSFPFTGSAIITGSLVVTGSIISTEGFTGSLYGTASWANNSTSASYALSSSYSVTSSHALVADSVLGSVTSASYAATSSHATNFTVQGTLLINGTLTDSATVNSSIVGSNNLFTQATSSRTSAFGKYTIFNGVNARAGEFITVWNGTTTTYTDISTTDIGDTSDITFSSAIVTGNIQINAIAASSGWTIKMLTTYI
jgi:hypothetical protein